MRKTGALMLAAFYLLLTTGAFVCILHCTGEYLFAAKQSAMAMHGDEHGEDADHHDDHDKSAHKENGKGKDKDDCGPGKDCNCCNKHGSYTIKENVNSSFEFQATALAIALKPVVHELAYSPQYSKEIMSWPHTTGPPVCARQPIYIQIRSLLI